jgi:hypothetical protein
MNNSAEQMQLVFPRGRDSGEPLSEREAAEAESDQKGKIDAGQESPWRDRGAMTRRCREDGGAGCCDFSSDKEHCSEEEEHAEVELALLSAQEQQAKTGEDYEQSEFEVLAAVKELVPRPDALSHRHRDEFESYEQEENAAETHDGPRTAKKCTEAGPRGDVKRNHLAVGRG